MYQYRKVLTRMRLGESERAIARSGLMGRQKAGALRAVAGREGWLEASSVLDFNPGGFFPDPVLATALLDRLLHHATTISISGDSYRLRHRRNAGLSTHTHHDPWWNQRSEFHNQPPVHGIHHSSPWAIKRPGA